MATVMCLLYATPPENPIIPTPILLASSTASRAKLLARYDSAEYAKSDTECFSRSSYNARIKHVVSMFVPSILGSIFKTSLPPTAEDSNFITNFLKDNPGYQTSGVKAIILAAGKSIRLYPYSQDLPKPLVPIGGQPILQRIIYSLKQYGIHDIIVITGFQVIRHNKNKI